MRFFQLISFVVLYMGVQSVFAKTMQAPKQSQVLTKKVTIKKSLKAKESLKAKKKRKLVKQCKDVLNTVFECTTTHKNKLLVCEENGRFEYRFIRTGSAEDTVINLAADKVRTYPLAKKSNTEIEALGFRTATREYQVFALYKKTNDPNNIYDDNISGGVKVLEKGKQVSMTKCAHSPDSISISEVISGLQQRKSQQSRKSQQAQKNKVSKQQRIARKNNQHSLKNTQTNNSMRSKTSTSTKKPAQKHLSINTSLPKNKPLPKSKPLPKEVKNIEKLIDHLGDDW